MNNPIYFSATLVTLLAAVLAVPDNAVAQGRSSGATNDLRKLPPFDLLRKHYPLGTPAVAKATIGGKVNLPWITNTCAVRVSHSLNLAGDLIPPTIAGYRAEDFAVSGRGHLRYVFRVRAMTDYLSQTYGPPAFVYKYNGLEVQIAPNQIRQKRGIIVFEIPTLDDATGHVDLWDGETCVYECWFAKADEFMFWECEDGPRDFIIE